MIERSNEKIEINTAGIKSMNAIIKEMSQFSVADHELAKEIKFNLKALMKKNGLIYIEDTDKKP